MRLNDAGKDTFLARLFESRQALDEIFALVEQNCEVTTLISKLNECSRYLDRASFSLMVSSLQGSGGSTESEKAENIKHLEQLFLHMN